MEEKYLKYTITNLCNEAFLMIRCGERDNALEILKTANRILKFEKWNRSPRFTSLYEELNGIVRQTAVEIAYTIIGE